MDQLTITICNKKVRECLIQGTKISFGLPYKSFSFIHPNEIFDNFVLVSTSPYNNYNWFMLKILKDDIKPWRACLFVCLILRDIWQFCISYGFLLHFFWCKNVTALTKNRLKKRQSGSSLAGFTYNSLFSRLHLVYIILIYINVAILIIYEQTLREQLIS